MNDYFSVCMECKKTKENFLFTPTQIARTQGSRMCRMCAREKQSKDARYSRSPKAKEQFGSDINEIINFKKPERKSR